MATDAQRGGALLATFGIPSVYHYAPLHYLAFIARQNALLSKVALRELGFSDSHFRTTSRYQDEQRGFAHYVHLTLDAHPPILQAKLGRGFPHFEIALPAIEFDETEYLLCRFNIAKTRYFRGAKQEPPESEKNGQYRSGMRLPVATTPQEREALLRLNLGENMIEVLVPNQVALTAKAVLRFFHDDDMKCANEVLETLGIEAFQIERDSEIEYKPSAKYRSEVRTALFNSLADPLWRGDGLEFDRM